MRILCTGVSGLFGRYFIESNADPQQFEIYGTSLNARPSEALARLAGYVPIPFDDLTKYKALLDEFRPDVIVHAGAEGNVDRAEENPTVAEQANLTFPLFLMEEAAARGARLIHFSSNAVYDGEHAPYSEQSPMQPINRYGEFKRRADMAMRRELGRWAILRPIVAYGWNFPFGRKNPVSQFLPLLREGKSLRVVDDQFENPVYAGDVARVLWRMIESGFCGELNVAGGDVGLSRYEWIRSVADAFSVSDSTITKASMRDFPTIAPRPRDTRFDITKLRREFDFEPLTVAQGAQAMSDDTARCPLLVGAMG